jgi:iron-sulfur cluster repair protein YtfE (RIC family)
MTTDPHPAAGHAPFEIYRLDHARVLERAAELEHRVLAGGVPDEALLQEAVALLAGPLAAHVTAEESVLFPALAAAFPAGRATLESLRDDHAELQLMLASATGWLDAPASAARDEQLQVVLRDVVDLLRLHIHREESAVFDVASRLLSNHETAELARRIAPLVDVNRPGSPAPGAEKGSQT